MAEHKSLKELRQEARDMKAAHKTAMETNAKLISDHAGVQHAQLGTIIEAMGEYVATITPNTFNVKTAKLMSKSLNQWALGNLTEVQEAAFVENGIVDFSAPTTEPAEETANTENSEEV